MQDYKAIPFFPKILLHHLTVGGTLSMNKFRHAGFSKE